MGTQEKSRWIEFWGKLRVKEEPAPYFADLAKLYSEPHRAYHNLAHVMDCLDQFQSVANQVKDATAVEMAIWYHDAIYDPRAKDNEERSAALAVQVGHQTGLTKSFNAKVEKLILATKKHDVSLGEDAPLMVDVDLSILGQSPQRFDEYENQIRKEYEWVSQEMFVTGRTAILKAFIDRPAIFSTGYFRDRYEQQARENLKRSILKLNK